MGTFDKDLNVVLGLQVVTICLLILMLLMQSETVQAKYAKMRTGASETALFASDATTTPYRPPECRV